LVENSQITMKMTMKNMKDLTEDDVTVMNVEDITEKGK
jgi:hypothetical protein